jgi:hypothetical protein
LTRSCPSACVSANFDTLFAALIRLRAGGLVIDPDALFTADRVLRYAAEYKTNTKPLATFVTRAASTSARSDLRVASGEVVEKRVHLGDI